MQKKERDLILNIESELCKRSLFYFFKEATKVLYPSVDWQYNWHLEYLCQLFQDEVERVIRQESKDKDIIVNIPFRSAKSTLISVILPVWWWIRQPSAALLTVSATDALAVKFAHQSKILIDSDWFKERFGHIFSIRSDQHAKGNYMTDKGGVRQAFGINSTIIGSGGHIICDDLNSPDDTSPIGLNNVINSYLDVLYSRLNNPDIDIRIILAQRVHELDISGYLIKNHKEKYHHVCLPVQITKDLSPAHLVEYYRDGLFHPERFSVKVIEDFKQTMRAQAFAGQLLQKPQPEEGTIIQRQWFKKVKWSDVMDLKLQWFLFLDTAFTDKQKNDASAFLLAARHNNKLYIRRSKSYWLKFNDLLNEIKEWQKVYDVKKIYIEEKASGISIVQELKRQTSHAVITMQPDGSKTERANAAQPKLQAGDVIIIEDEWNDAFLSECAAFPLGSNDDKVDTLLYAVDELLNKSGKTIMITR